jgi:hypothetical protein
MTILGKNFRLGEAGRSEDARPLLADTQTQSSDDDRSSETSPQPVTSPRDSSIINMAQPPGTSNSAKQSDFMFIKIVARITLQVVSCLVLHYYYRLGIGYHSIEYLM